MICDALISTRLCRIYLGVWVLCANAAEDLAWYEWGPLNSQDLADRQAPNLDALLHASLTPTLPNSDGAKVVNTAAQSTYSYSNSEKSLQQAHLEVGRNVQDWGPQLPGIHGTSTTSVQPMLDSALTTWSDPYSELATNPCSQYRGLVSGFNWLAGSNPSSLACAETGWTNFPQFTLRCWRRNGSVADRNGRRIKPSIFHSWNDGYEIFKAVHQSTIPKLPVFWISCHGPTKQKD
ncbi:uncharacterized protein PGTG_21069 [Puccinia graminis f. sp. tritici CRL 75-36-700-3]|uniref:Uncharacterized protein n=1 Tax=Puccinia graminis f. sp. tritici (strain CRL 75-36-700-3 / race SCCL) TaxID=418459 RepID=H6QQA9_PUCGT|nr:uncharacterized protein PGTG_21069 [Puccinia graminis f. sp. tritici CRL 75-36-700-3]EHS64811.1 hypothetical protein PGTG_21069 [Puccinia graminis f. sp. tritici CRL 75-36-700-3]